MNGRIGVCSGIVAVVAALLLAGCALGGEETDDAAGDSETIVGSTPQALSRTCAVNGYHALLPNTCHTQSLWAEPVGDFVKISVEPYAGCSMDFRVVDIANNHVVHSGRTARSYNRTLFGLYSAYQLQVTAIGRGCGGDAMISNSF